MELDSFVGSLVTLISDQVLVCLLHNGVCGCLLAGHALWILILVVWINKLWVIIVIIFLRNFSIPALLAYERIACLLVFLGVVFEKSC